jgi:hypothetical protein
LKDALGSSGLTSNDIAIKLLTRLMQEYRSNEDEWRRFALVDPNSGYTRNLVDQGNGKSNLVSLHPTTIHPFQAYQVASACLGAWQRQPRTQPQQRTLPDEDPLRSAH